jgi:hypothetical protein
VCNAVRTQSSQRMAVERAFGLLVGRWGLLWRPLKVKGRNRAVMLDAIVRLHNLCVDETVDWSMREEQQVREAAGLVRTADGRWMERDNVTKLAGTEVPCNAHAEAARRGNDGATDASCGTGPASADAGSRPHRRVPSTAAAVRRAAIPAALGRAGKTRPPIGS